MKNMKWIAVLVIAMSIAVGLAACGGGGSSSESSSEAESSETEGSESSGGEAGGTEDVAEGEGSESSEPFVIGVAYSKSGLASAYDISAYNALKAWVTNTNAEGGLLGREVKLVTANAKSSPEGAKSAAEAVISDGAEMLVGPCDFDLGATAGIAAEKAGLVDFSLCASSPKWGTQGIGPHSFTPGSTTTAEGYAYADYSYTGKGWKTAATLLDESLPSYDEGVCNGFKERYNELGGKIVTEQTFPGGEEVGSIESQVSAIEKANPEVIMLCSYPPGGPTALKQLRAAGVDTPVISDTAMDGDYWLEAVPTLSNFYTGASASLYGDDPNPEVNKVVKQIAKESGEPPLTSLGLDGYALGQLYGQAVKNANSFETEPVTEALNEFNEVPTLLGPTTYTPEAHIALTRPLAIIEIANGKPKYLESAQTKGNPPLFPEE